MKCIFCHIYDEISHIIRHGELLHKTQRDERDMNHLISLLICEANHRSEAGRLNSQSTGHGGFG